MRFPDDVTILRASGADEYGNPGSSWDAPEEFAAKGFMLREACLMPAGTDVRVADRLRFDGRAYAVDGEPFTIRSPNKPIMVRVAVRRLEV